MRLPRPAWPCRRCLRLREHRLRNRLFQLFSVKCRAELAFVIVLRTAAAAAPTWSHAGSCATASTRASTWEAPVSTRAMTEPFDTLSPALSSTSVTVPAAVAGTSIDALSVSSVTSGASTSTVSPFFTNTSTTRISSKLPISGTVRSTRLTAQPPRGRAHLRASAPGML